MQQCFLRRPNVKTTQTILEQGTDTVLLLSAHTQINHANNLNSVNTTTELAQYNYINPDIRPAGNLVKKFTQSQ